MKKITLFAAFACALFLGSSCNRNNQPSENNAISTAVEQTRGSHSEDAPSSTQSAKKVMLARKWKNGDKFVDIKLEGAFTANFGSGEFAGTWELNEESGALMFNGQGAADGKGHAEKMSFTLKDISDNSLKITDASGAESTFSAE